GVHQTGLHVQLVVLAPLPDPLLVPLPLYPSPDLLLRRSQASDMGLPGNVFIWYVRILGVRVSHGNLRHR
nr:hypothetical protein [Tanacetum cinerariifolium]